MGFVSCKTAVLLLRKNSEWRFIMKKRKGSLLQRMLAVLLAAVLVTGMVSNAEPVSVLAQEEMQESVSGNAVEIPEGDIAPEEETEPAERTEPDEGAGQETQELGTISTNDIGTASVAEPQSVMMAAEPAPQANNIASGNDWVLDADGKLTISSDDGMADWENYMRGDYEYYTRQVVNVEIQDGVTSLGNNAFYNYGELTGITIADSVTSIAGSAFCGCWKLRKITIPNNVTSISDRMFMNSGLEEITILGSVTSIGEFAFWGCGLKKITIPDSVQSIGEKAFIYCDNLNEVIIKSETPPTLGDGVFTDCGFVKDNTQSIHVPEGKAQAYKTAWTDWAAYIADDTPTPPAEEHKHNNVTFTAWTATDSLPTDPGNYYLTDNVTLTETWTVPNGTTTLCLNGKTISASGTDGYRVITINISPVLNLYDCRNTGNITGGKDGGVWNDGTFCMYGGKISGNATQTYNHGGGVWNNNNFYMYGGEISGNTASIGFGGGVETYGEFRMYGGKISGNTAGGSGGGVHINGSGEFIVGGGAVISGNTYNGTENNVYLKDGQMIVLDSGVPFSGSANIGVTTKTVPTEGNPVDVTGHNKGDYSSYFTSDNPAYEIVNANDYVQLAVKASPDTQPPTGKIEVATGDLTSASWTEFLAPDQVAFNLFFKDRKWVTIFSADEGGSGVYGTHYYVSNVALTKAQVEALDADAWTADATVILEPEPDRKCIVYAKITDGAGNVTYLSSDGMVFDATPPVINGVTNGETYNAPQTVTVTDAMSGVKSVTVNGTEVALTGDQFTLGTADGSQTIVAADQAGNTATVTVTVQAQTQSYAVTVRNGTGTGIYRAGDTVEITADAPASGKQFDRWLVGRGGITLADSTSSTTTFTMPERDVEIEATYKDITEEHTHNYGDWQHDDTQHWKACACGEETGRGNHDFGDWITDKAATATEAGTKHRECQTCGYRQTETIPATGESHTHNYGDWQHDSTQHWKVCSCGDETGRANHDYGEWITDQAATATETGTRHRDCQTCGYSQTETIPATGGDPGSGTVTPEVKPGTNAPATNISTTTEELKDMLLTDDEKQQVQNGTNIRIVLEVQDAGNTVSVSDRAAVAQALNGYTVGQYLNIDLYKLVGADRTDITETAKKIRIVITVPDSLKNADSSKTRAFAVIRVHDGGAELLADQDGSADTITIETDRFSTYAIVYKDTANSSGENSGNDDNHGGDGNNSSSNNDNNGNDNSSSNNNSQNNSDKNDTKPDSTKDDEPKTGDATPIELYATLTMIAGFAYLLLYFSDRKRGMTEETKKELVSRLVGWAKQGGRIRKCLALAAVFVLLVYYHSIGKKTCAEWKEIYGE